VHSLVPRRFALGICRHFALLFAAGADSPPPSVAGGGGGGGGNASGGVAALGGDAARVSSLKELDPHIFLDALIEVRLLFWPLGVWCMFLPLSCGSCLCPRGVVHVLALRGVAHILLPSRCASHVLAPCTWAHAAFA
jgi:hypothetical protein